MRISSTAFQHNVGRYQVEAQRAPVAITKNGKPYTVLMSAALFETVVQEQGARPMRDMDDDGLRGIGESEAVPEYGELDGLMNDW